MQPSRRPWTRTYRGRDIDVNISSRTPVMPCRPAPKPGRDDCCHDYECNHDLSSRGRIVESTVFYVPTVPMLKHWHCDAPAQQPSSAGSI
nr:hypothetical protein CFP56_33632 [Quercus suber]